MNNHFITTVRGILVDFWNKRKALAETYRAEKASGMASEMRLNMLATELEEAGAADYNAAVEQINAVHQQTVSDVKAWGALNGADLCAEDVALVNLGMTMTVDDVAALVDRHHDNATMCKWISYQIKAGKLPSNVAIVETLVNADPATKLDAYAVLKAKALNVLGGGKSMIIPQIAGLLNSDYQARYDHRFETFADPVEHPELASTIAIVGDSHELK